MKAGDLVRNRTTGDLAIVAKRGRGDLGIWKNNYKKEIWSKE